MAAGDLITVDELRSYLRLPDTEDDPFLADLVTEASYFVKGECGRDFIATDYTDTYDGDGSFSIRLRQYPVISVTSVTLDSEVIPKRPTVNDAGWVLNGDRVELSGGYRFASYAFGPGSSRGYVSYGPGSRSQNVTIVYRAGYETIPPDLKHAARLRAAIQYYDRSRLGKSSVGLQGESVSFNAGAQMAIIDDILQGYRRL